MTHMKYNRIFVYKWLMSIIVFMMVTSCSNNGLKSDNDPKKEQQSVQLVISAAASLSKVMEELERNFSIQHPNIQLTFNFASSGTLQHQIEQGAPVDLFFSAGLSQLHTLVEQQFIKQYTELLNNKLVLIASTSLEGFEGMDKVKPMEWLHSDFVSHIAVGDPQTVPAGAYTKQSLHNMKLSESLQSKLIYAKDVRQVLTYVETGNVEAGFVYATDAASSNKVAVLQEMPQDSYETIMYPLGIVEGTNHMEEAKMVYQYMQSAAAYQIYEKHGFTVVKGQ